MKEQEGKNQNEIQNFPKRFESAREYWLTALTEKRIHNTSFLQEVFKGPNAELYQERADDEMLMLIARTLNSTWVGRESTGRVDTINVGLPASSAASTSSTTGESASSKS